MKLNIFYSWQSDINSNRNFIQSCIEKATKNIYKNNNFLTEYKIDSDSRDEFGTPDIVNSIFAKIDVCDIFIADTTIINSDDKYPKRKTSNPNVLIELGYACSTVGWENIICIFNDDYGKKEDLPFDIRHRKPLSYDTKDKASAKKLLISLLEKNMQGIIEKRLHDKSYYHENKQEIDLAIQSILISLLKILNFFHKHDIELYDYSKLLHMTREELELLYKNNELLGFQLHNKSLEKMINEFTEYFNNDLSTYFFNEKEKHSFAKIIMSLKRFVKVFYSNDTFKEVNISSDYTVVSGKKMNPSNPNDSYLLLKSIDKEKGVVVDFGHFSESKVETLNKIYKINDNKVNAMSHTTHNLLIVIQDWIRITGYFIFNSRLLNEK